MVGGGGKTVAATQPHVFGGDLVLEDARPLSVVDVATAQVTVKLTGVDTQVGATSYSDVETVPVEEGTMLVNRKTGTFNLLGHDDYVLILTGPEWGSVLFPGWWAPGVSRSARNAYIVRSSPHSTVSLVDQQTVTAAAKAQAGASASRGSRTGSTPVAAVNTLGFASLPGTVSTSAGAAAVSGSNLWTLMASGSSCLADELQPVATSHEGLVVTPRTRLTGPCAWAAIQSSGGLVGLASPGHVRLFSAGGKRSGRDVPVARTASDRTFVPVYGASGNIWFLAGSNSGWSVFGVRPNGAVTEQTALVRFGARRADPVAPVESGGVLYTLDQAALGQPTLWTIAPSTAPCSPSRRPTYPAASPSDRAVFSEPRSSRTAPGWCSTTRGATGRGVFTDGSHAPVIVDKSRAMAVSATGPVDVNAAGRPHRRPARAGRPVRAALRSPCRSSSRSARGPPVETPPRSRTPRRSPPSRPCRDRP